MEPLPMIASKQDLMERIRDAKRRMRSSIDNCQLLGLPEAGDVTNDLLHPNLCRFVRRNMTMRPRPPNPKRYCKLVNYCSQGMPTDRLERRWIQATLSQKEELKRPCFQPPFTITFDYIHSTNIVSIRNTNIGTQSGMRKNNLER